MMIEHQDFDHNKKTVKKGQKQKREKKPYNFCLPTNSFSLCFNDSSMCTHNNIVFIFWL